MKKKKSAVKGAKTVSDWTRNGANEIEIGWR
jgi:hypothetical protein